MSDEDCCYCGEPTGRAGRADDSLYFENDGPYCRECYEKIKDDEGKRMTKHTPGPWRYEPSLARPVTLKRKHWKVGSNSTGKGVALAFGDGDANARLIAAAPEMLEALKNLENDDGKRMPASAWALVQNAIRKAEGGNV